MMTRHAGQFIFHDSCFNMISIIIICVCVSVLQTKEIHIQRRFDDGLGSTFAQFDGPSFFKIRGQEFSPYKSSVETSSSAPVYQPTQPQQYQTTQPQQQYQPSPPQKQNKLKDAFTRCFIAIPLYISKGVMFDGRLKSRNKNKIFTMQRII